MTLRHRWLLLLCSSLLVACGKGEQPRKSETSLASSEAVPRAAAGSPSLPATEAPPAVPPEVPTEADFEEEAEKLSPAELERELDLLEKELGR